MQEVSNLFVCLMGMGITFFGLSCIIGLTMLMGRVMESMAPRQPEKAAAPSAPPPARTAAPPVPAPAPADGLTDEIRIAILAALAQEPGFHMENVTNITIQRR